MNNFRRKSPRQRHHRRAAVDGIIRGNPQQPDKRKKPARISPLTTPGARRIGDFKNTDGFHPVQQPTMAQKTEATATRPLTGRRPKRDPLGRIELQLPDAPKSKKGVKNKDWRKVALKTLGVILVAGVLTGGYLFGKGYLKAREIFKGGGGAAALEENVDPSRLKGEGDGRVNILLLGKGGAGHDAPDLTDTILIASLDPIQKEAALLSIPRDLYIKDNGSYSKINSVYANAKYQVLNNEGEAAAAKAEEAGLTAIDRAVENHMGIPIHYHVMVDFHGFQRAIDEVGGIDIEVTEETSVYEHMHINGRPYLLNAQPGRQHFDGFKALAYARSRMTSPRGDFDRTERQRLVLLALKDKILSAGTFADPRKVSGLIDAFGDNMRSNLTIAEIMRLYEIGKDIDGSKVASIGLADPPNSYVQTANVDGLSVVVPKAGLNDFSEIRSFVRNALKDGFIRNENASIAVLNGTSIPGLAGRRAEDLRSFGYNITDVADAPTATYTDTILVDLRNGEKRYTKSYLERRLNTTAVNNLPDNAINPGNADFVIILGTDEGHTY